MSGQPTGGASVQDDGKSRGRWVTGRIAIVMADGTGQALLRLYVNERSLAKNHETCSVQSLTHQSDLGIKLAIDDFGAGYFRLSYLRQFPIDFLKIDQSFANHMTSNADDATIVSAMISMGKSLNKQVIAEGVQSAFLLALNCDEGQGYYFGRPVTVEALIILLKTGVLLSFID
ncbi:MAG: EAL domain-containing protein [Halobacteriota archaeon]